MPHSARGHADRPVRTCWLLHGVGLRCIQFSLCGQARDRRRDRELGARHFARARDGRSQEVSRGAWRHRTASAWRLHAAVPCSPCDAAHAMQPCDAAMRCSHAMQPMRCSHAMQPMRCSPCDAAHAMPPMPCSPCHAAHAMQPMRCSPCDGAHAMQPMRWRPCDAATRSGCVCLPVCLIPPTDRRVAAVRSVTVLCRNGTTIIPVADVYDRPAVGLLRRPYPSPCSSGLLRRPAPCAHPPLRLLLLLDTAETAHSFPWSPAWGRESL
jgi:hypothetical protein